MGFLNKLERFARKSEPERRNTLRFYSRQALSKMPFLPVRLRLDVAPGECLRFWWSHLPSVDQAGRTLLQYWGDDDGELRFLWKFLQPEMTFFDVGAFHGIFSLVASRKLASQGRIVAFEPSPRERRRFKLHMRMNRVGNVRLEPYAASAEMGAAKFFTVASGPTSMNSLQPPAVDCPIREISVQAITLDHYLNQRKVPSPDLMKIDVEGAELAAFAGASNLLTSIRPLIICEILDWVTQPWGYRAREIIHCLKSRDYSWFDFDPDGRIAPHVSREAYPDVRNYLAVPAEKIRQLGRWVRV
jgi:FkbM family methyltransferase